MNNVKDYTYSELIKLLIGKKVNFISDCEFFPNFNVTGKIINYKINPNELVFYVKVKSKQITIGTNMKNLQFNII